MKHCRDVLIMLSCIALVACRAQPDLASRRAEILDLHRSFIQAHLDKDAEFIARPTAPGYFFVSDGQVTPMDAAGMHKMLSDYLTSTEFSHYRDEVEPIIGISEDGSLAWAIVQVRVAGSSTAEDGSTRAFDTLWAWITLYERKGEEWLRVADVSTRRPYGTQP